MYRYIHKNNILSELSLYQKFGGRGWHPHIANVHETLFGDIAMMTPTMKDNRLWIAGVVATVVLVVAVAYFGGFFGNGVTETLLPADSEISSPEG